MSKNKFILILGVLVALTPFLGFPHLWESIFQVIAGLAVVILSVWATIDKKLTFKAKAQRRQIHRRREAEIEAQKEVIKQQALQEENS